MTTRLENEEAAAWQRYRSTLETGGTPEQRTWAFDRWIEKLNTLVYATAIPHQAQAKA